jgi:hypothetical protein
MDSQTNALFDNPTFPKHSLSEVTFNSQKNVKSSPSGKKFVILHAERSNEDSSTSGSTVPFLSPSISFSKIRMQQNAKSLRTGDPSLTFSHPNMLMAPQFQRLAKSGSYVFNDGSTKMFSDASSVRSLASIGMGSTDGKRMVIRKVPNSPSELLSYLSPPT